MKLFSQLSAKAYLHTMRSQMRSHMEFGAERFTGFFLGNVFSVTYHSGYEFDRRYNNPKNSALGFVVKRESGCSVHFIRLKGALNPPAFLMLSLILTLMLLFSGMANGIPVYAPEFLLLCAGLGFGSMAIAAPISALFECFSERSAEGARILLSFLQDPTSPYPDY